MRFFQIVIVFLLIVCSSRSEAWIKILQGDKIDVGMNYTVAVACTSNEIGGFYDYYEWSNYSWGGGDWLTSLGGNYAVFLFDPYFTGYPPEPFDAGTLTLYTGYYGSSDKIVITAIPTAPNYGNGETCKSEGDPANPVIGNNFTKSTNKSFNSFSSIFIVLSNNHQINL